MMVKEYEMQISKVQEWCEGIKSIFLEYTGNEKMQFKSGQYVFLKAQVDGKLTVRAYSIASTPYDDKIEILFRVVGTFTNYLNTLSVGDKILMVGPFGSFSTEEAKNKKIVYIATGTGISPLLSMLRTLFKENKCSEYKKIVFIYGTRYKKMLVCKEEFDNMMKTCENFEFVPVLSREEEWRGRKGHVQNCLGEYIFNECDYFICGLPIMTDDVKKLLIKKGIAEQNIHTEKY